MATQRRLYRNNNFFGTIWSTILWNHKVIFSKFPAPPKCHLIVALCYTDRGSGDYTFHWCHYNVPPCPLKLFFTSCAFSIISVSILFRATWGIEYFNAHSFSSCFILLLVLKLVLWESVSDELTLHSSTETASKMSQSLPDLWCYH